MKESSQDRIYREAEGDQFFERNLGTIDPQGLRPKKLSIVEALEAAGVAPRRVLEFGCNFGDLLGHYARAGAECYGIEASAKAVEFGRGCYAGQITLAHGTIADNPINASGEQTGRFDLIVVDDVLCWVSRETLYQSIANIDDLLAEGGHLFLREFLPVRSVRNRNHHVDEAEVYCYKPAGPHAAIFTASALYAPVWQRVYIDHDDAWARERNQPLEARWIDCVLRKSYSDYYVTT